MGNKIESKTENEPEGLEGVGNLCKQSETLILIACGIHSAEAGFGEQVVRVYAKGLSETRKKESETGKRESKRGERIIHESDKRITDDIITIDKRCERSIAIRKIRTPVYDPEAIRNYSAQEKAAYRELIGLMKEISPRITIELHHNKGSLWYSPSRRPPEVIISYFNPKVDRSLQDYLPKIARGCEISDFSGLEGIDEREEVRFATEQGIALISLEAVLNFDENSVCEDEHYHNVMRRTAELLSSIEKYALILKTS